MFGLKTTQGKLTAVCERIARIYEECVIEAFIEWAQEDDEYLRSNQGFNDQTGNLRSSLGAAVYHDAKKVFSTPFAAIRNGSEGSQEGRRATDAFTGETVGKIAKLMVAGMDYAQRVEDIDSKDVLESRRIQCEREARKVMERAALMAERRIMRL